ncbi:MAG: uracil-DNA glycosylase [Lentisphaeria bacterium]|nr:uracil-DNA glycosylase [Lentisphaeria bacterium]
MEFFDEIISVLKQEAAKKERVFLDAEVLDKLGENASLMAAKKPGQADNCQVRQSPDNVVDAAFSEKLSNVLQGKTIAECANSNDEIKNLVLNCGGCELSKYRQHAISGCGNINSRLMFIGEAPSAADDAENRLFSGDVGELLDKMITAMGFAGREEVYLTTMLKCRPPGNRVAEKQEVDSCIDFLKKEIELVKPEAIVVFGANTIKHLIGKEGSISELRGKMLYYGNIPVMPTFNPAYLLRKAAAKREVWQDLQEVMKILGMKK